MWQGELPGPRCMPSLRGRGVRGGRGVEGEGKVLTYTDVYALAIDYETRYLRLAIVEFEGGLRATGQLEDPAPQIGKRVRATIGTVRQVGDRGIEGLIFVPA